LLWDSKTGKFCPEAVAGRLNLAPFSKATMFVCTAPDKDVQPLFGAAPKQMFRRRARSTGVGGKRAARAAGGRTGMRAKPPFHCKREVPLIASIDDRMRGVPFFGALRYAFRANSYQFVAIQWLVPSDVLFVVL
jgi:hypothetical protein